MMLESLLKQINDSPDTVEFDQVMTCIAQHYNYTPSRFYNGTGEDKVVNEAGNNEGSCKIFAFAQLNGLDETQTLHCFGKYYREDVLAHPDGTDHANIRSFMKSGWPGISFETQALSRL